MGIRKIDAKHVESCGNLRLEESNFAGLAAIVWEVLLLEDLGVTRTPPWAVSSERPWAFSSKVVGHASLTHYLFL
jgi:hypothetical protein